MQTRAKHIVSLNKTVTTYHKVEYSATVVSVIEVHGAKYYLTTKRGDGCNVPPAKTVPR